MKRPLLLGGLLLAVVATAQDFSLPIYQRNVFQGSANGINCAAGMSCVPRGSYGRPVDFSVQVSTDQCNYDGGSFAVGLTDGGISCATVATGATGGTAVFGDGVDGTNTAVCCGTLAANCTLTRDIFCTNLTAGGYTVTTAGYRIWATGTVSVADGGAISNAGANASGATGGNGGLTGTCAGANPGAAGTWGVGGTTANLTQSYGGNGGNGGAGSGNAGGTGGTVTPPSAGSGSIHEQWAALHCESSGAGFLIVFYPGVPGASGGGDGTNFSGGGGGGGGFVGIAAKTITVSAGGTITAAGGAGGTQGVGNVGGGGGGGGGILVLVYGTLTNSGSITAAGGAAGNGFGTGAAGTAGAAGIVVQFQN